MYDRKQQAIEAARIEEEKKKEQQEAEAAKAAQEQEQSDAVLGYSVESGMGYLMQYRKDHHS